MVDKVKPLKIEDASSGSQVNPFPRETDPTEDYLAGRGLAFENLDTHLIDRSGNNIQVTDPTIGTMTISQLRTALNNTFDNSTNGFTAAQVQAAIEEAKSTATGTAAGFGVLFGKSGQVKNKWMDYFSSISSDTATFIAAEDLTITSVSGALSLTGTGEVEIYVNGGVSHTLTFTASDEEYDTGLSVAVLAGQAIAAKVTNTGTLRNPVVTVFSQVG